MRGHACGCRMGPPGKQRGGAWTRSSGRRRPRLSRPHQLCRLLQALPYSQPFQHRRLLQARPLQKSPGQRPRQVCPAPPHVSGLVSGACVMWRGVVAAQCRPACHRQAERLTKLQIQDARGIYMTWECGVQEVQWSLASRRPRRCSHASRTLRRHCQAQRQGLPLG